MPHTHFQHLLCWLWVPVDAAWTCDTDLSFVCPTHLSSCLCPPLRVVLSSFFHVLFLYPRASLFPPSTRSPFAPCTLYCCLLFFRLLRPSRRDSFSPTGPVGKSALRFIGMLASIQFCSLRLPSPFFCFHAFYNLQTLSTNALALANTCPCAFWLKQHILSNTLALRVF